MHDVKQLTVISGKGGTGKTTITAMFSYLAKNAVIADGDVDAPNLHLLLNPVVLEEFPFYGMKKARIDNELCTECGLCYDLCRFDAIYVNEEYHVDDIKCEGCAVCYNACPVEAVEMTNPRIGKVFSSKTDYGRMVHATLNPGEENSGKLVSEVREKAKDVAKEIGVNLLILDGAPGIGCQVIASLSMSSMALIVTEPTISGLKDANRVHELTKYFGIKSGMVINKYDLNEDMADRIEDYCADNDIEFMGKIPFDPHLHSQISQLEFPFKGKAADKMEKIWERIEHILK
ncbi:MAG: ATP-binding protein [Halobacteriota archaeon]